MEGRGIDVAALARTSGIVRDQPLIIAACDDDGLVLNAAHGSWNTGAAVAPADLCYAASLSKQITGAAIALLVRDDRLDPDAEIPSAFVPRWPERPTVRQLLHHTGGMPAAGTIEAGLNGENWTDEFALRRLAEAAPPAQPPGTVFAYSNLGYVVLARLVEQASGMMFAQFVKDRILVPLDLSGMQFARAGKPPASPQLDQLEPILPLSTGDGGIRTTAAAFANWLAAQNRDALGIVGPVTADARLPSGEAVGYGWGIGLRTFRGHDLFVHSGGWAGTRARAVRCPTLRLSVAGFAADLRDEPLSALVDLVLNHLADTT